MMGVEFRRPGRDAGAFGRRRRAARRPAADRRPGQRSARVLPQQLRGGPVAAHAPARHSRLRVGRAHGLRVRRPGAGTALKLIRRGVVDHVLAGGFDSMISPVGISRLLPAVGALAGQRHAAAREPPVRRDAQRLPAGRRRGFPGARGMARGAQARRAHLRGAGRRRQFAVELPDHRFAARRRRPDPGDASGAVERGRHAGRHRLPECARHVHRHERPQRERGDQGGVRRRRPAPFGQLDQEHDGPPDRGRRRRRSAPCARWRFATD